MKNNDNSVISSLIVEKSLLRTHKTLIEKERRRKTVRNSWEKGKKKKIRNALPTSLSITGEE